MKTLASKKAKGTKCLKSAIALMDFYNTAGTNEVDDYINDLANWLGDNYDEYNELYAYWLDMANKLMT